MTKCNECMPFNDEFRFPVQRYACFVVYSSSLEVRRTWLTGCNFMGLFAARHFARGEIVCVYFGELLRTAEAISITDKSYLMRLGEQCYVDAKLHTDVHAR